MQPWTTGQTLKDLRAVMGPSLGGILIPKIESPADVHAVDALLTCMEAEFGLELGQRRRSTRSSRPPPRSVSRTRSPPRRPRVTYMGGAISRFGDIHQAIGFRWTAEGEETLFLRSKVLIDARAAGIRYPISGMWGGDRDDLDGLREFAVKLRNLGYYGMMLGDPVYIPLVHEVFSPTADGARRTGRTSTGSPPKPSATAAARSSTATPTRARATSCTSRTWARRARTSPGRATWACSNDRHRQRRAAIHAAQICR